MIDPDELAHLEHEVNRALHRGDASSLDVLGYGEISLVLGWPVGQPKWACKRLPPFPSGAAVDAYHATLDDYLAELTRRGVTVVDSEVQRVGLSGGRVAVYCVQPVLPRQEIAVDIVRRGGPKADRILTEIVETVLGVVDDRIGLDAQLSNWAWNNDHLTYFDVTTPMVRRADGTEALDTEVFLASLPWLLRAPVRRFVLPDLMDRYHTPRSVVLDMAANLIKERLEDRIALVISTVADHVTPPLTGDEVRTDYRSDARTWRLLQSLRRVDRFWQQRLRRRTYPFLLPARIER